MKYLESYNVNITKQDVIDCFQDIIDVGFDVHVEIYKVNYLDITICLYENDELRIRKYFNIDEIKETLMFALPYIENKYAANFGKIEKYIQQIVTLNQHGHGFKEHKSIKDLYDINNSVSMLFIKLKLI